MDIDGDGKMSVKDYIGTLTTVLLCAVLHLTLGFPRFLALGDLGPKLRAAGGPVISAPDLRKRETSGTQGNSTWEEKKCCTYIPPFPYEYAQRRITIMSFPPADRKDI